MTSRAVAKVDTKAQKAPTTLSDTKEGVDLFEEAFANGAIGSSYHTPNYSFHKTNVYRDDIPKNPAPLVQAKLVINQSGDKYEQEADAMAAKVVRRPEPENNRISSSTHSIRCKCADCEEEETKKKIQRKENEVGVILAGNALSTYLSNINNSGSPLSKEERAFFEPRFGHDFSKVRIHRDSCAQQSAKDINAKAYTHQRNIIFGPGEYNSQTLTGRELLAHELMHVVQQANGYQNILQRAPKLYGGPTAAPPDWSTKVAAATDSSSKAALIQSVLGSTVSVVDKTAQCSGDTSPDPAHLVAYTASSAVINYDENLTSKSARAGGRSLSTNAGYTFYNGKNNYVVLSSKVIVSDSYYATLYTVNHELDHVRQNIAGSSLGGNSSELDAWTTSFTREFHKSYIIQERGTGGDCIINTAQQYVPLLGYYEASGVSSTDQSNAVKRISEYYNASIKSNSGHLAVFKYWLRRSLSQSRHILADELIKALNLSITSGEPLGNYTKFSCADIASQTYQAPTLSLPTFPSTGSTKKP